MQRSHFKKLSLRRETVRELTDRAAEQVVGGSCGCNVTVITCDGCVSRTTRIIDTD